MITEIEPVKDIQQLPQTPAPSPGLRHDLLLVLSAYPNNPAARKAIKPQAKWSNAK